MRAGKVVQIRLNPKDCMSVVDVLDVAGINIKDLSYAQAVSLAMGSILAGLREAGTIPDRDGFEYSEVMAPWDSGRSKRKLDVTRFISQQSGLQPRPVAVSSGSHLEGQKAVTGSPIGRGKSYTPAQRRAAVKLQELQFKQEHDPQHFTTDDRDEMERLEMILDGD